MKRNENWKYNIWEQMRKNLENEDWPFVSFAELREDSLKSKEKYFKLTI